MDTIRATDLKPRLTSGEEIAFIDVREHGQYGEGHPFFAVSIPYSDLEARVTRMLPRKGINAVLLDDDDGVAEKAARRMAAMGYSSLAKLDGGAAGWVAAGHTLFKGVNLPSKTLGELVEHAAGTPSLTAPELMAMMQSGQPFVLLDGRTPAEFSAMRIDRARSCPNAELGHRLGQFVPDDETPIVINCAGRTRSIIGAQGLINQGVKNPIHALENGTAGWQLAGYDVERESRHEPLAALDADQLSRSRDTARSLSERFGVSGVDLAMLGTWIADPDRTTYLFDVRTAEEYAARHMPGSIHAPGGQLAQATDLFVAARGARLVLLDDTGLRAANTAIWLAQMGHDVHVLNADISQPGAHDDFPEAPPPPLSLPPQISAERAMASGAVLLDVGNSMSFRQSHIRGARWATRSRLETLGLPTQATVILTGPASRVAAAAIDLSELGIEDVHYLSEVEGLEHIASPDDPPDRSCIDYLFFVHDRHHGNMEAAQAYLDWEIGLLDQLDTQERGAFALAWS